MNQLPAIHLEIHQVERKISGDIIFYLQKRDAASAPWHVAGESTLPLLVPHAVGESLSFEVQHHRCHGCSELGSSVKFRMALAGPNQARLWNLSEGSDSAPGMLLVRQTESTGSSAPAMQEGITVELPVTRHARSMPEADRSDSSIVSVTATGDSYFGIDPITPAALAEKLKQALLGHPEKKVYLKADARTSYVYVEKILDAIGAAGVREPTLLTVEPDAAKPGTRVPPNGLEVLIGAPSVAASRLPVIQVFNSGQGSPALKINDQNVPLTKLESRLEEILNQQPEKVVRLEADGQLPFARVVDVADACQSKGAEVVLSTGAHAEKASAMNHESGR